MNRSYNIINIIAFAVFLQFSCFGMQHQSICTVLPLETNKTIFNFLNLYLQDQLRATCSYWKKIGDERSSHLLDLLHSPSNTTTETKVRILFDAVYHNNYDLAEHMLKVTPEHHINHPLCPTLDLYAIAEKNGDPKTIQLMEKYEKLRRDNTMVKYIEPPIFLELIISCISGNHKSVKEIIDVKFNIHKIYDLIKKNNGDPFNKPIEILQYALDFPTIHDDNQCILAWNGLFKDNPEVNYILEKSLIDACSFKRKKAFKALLQQKNNINEVLTQNYNGANTLITIKNQILGGTIWQPLNVFTENKEYRDEIEAILNECGAKTYEELQAEKIS